MTSTGLPRSRHSGPARTVLAAVVVAVALVVVAVPATAAGLVGDRRDMVPAGAEQTAPLALAPVVRFAPPAGWSTESVPSQVVGPFVYRSRTRRTARAAVRATRRGHGRRAARARRRLQDTRLRLAAAAVEHGSADAARAAVLRMREHTRFPAHRR